MLPLNVNNRVSNLAQRRLAAVICATIALFSMHTGVYADMGTTAIRGSETVTLNDQGDEIYTGHVQFPNEALYLSVKQAYPNPYVMVRQVLGSSSTVDIADSTINYDDGKRSVDLSATLHGAAFVKGNRWQMKTGKDVELLFNDKEKCILISVGMVPGSTMLLVTSTVLNLPAGAANVKHDPTAGILSFNLQRQPKTGAANLDISLKAKPRLMSAIYKIYGNEDFAGGAFWAAKTVFHNTGAGDITNLKVSYRIGEYSEWSPETAYSLVPAGGYLVSLYYPLLKSSVANLSSTTPADIEVKYSYADPSGATVSDSASKRISLLGANQFEYSTLTDEERTGTWLDSFSASPLAAAFVTKMDEPVRQFAGMAAQYSGGQPAAYNDNAAVAFCKALYDLESDNGIAYQSAVGLLSDYKGAGQELKYPRDVLRDKSGTCIELAMLYAAVCESVGLKCDIQMIPGHAFPVVQLPVSGNYLPVESTGLSGPAVGANKALTFDDAVKMATDEFSKRQAGQNILIDVEQMQEQGVLCPELPPMPSDIIYKWGYKAPAGTDVQKQAAAQGPGAATGGAGALPEGFEQWQGPNGTVTAAFPSSWARTEKPTVAGMIFAAADARTSLWLNIFQFPNVKTPADAMNATKDAIAAASGGTVRVATTQQNGNAVSYTGSTRMKNGTSSVWIGVFKATGNGVTGVFIGAKAQTQLDRNSQTVQAIIQHTQIGGGQ